VKKYVAEFIGTFVLVFIGCGTAATVGCDPKAGSGYILTALAFGLSIVAMAYSIGNISGCHVNPAVSLSCLLAGRMPVKDFVGYVVAQFLGAIAAAGVLTVFVSPAGGLGTNALFHGEVGPSFLIEVILTFIFTMAVLGATAKPENASVAGLVIGLSLTLVHILGIAYTGTSVNPARSFGPALFVGGKALADVWVFILAPLVGGALSAFVYNFLSDGEGSENA
jgi:aquaporin Z